MHYKKKKEIKISEQLRKQRLEEDEEAEKREAFTIGRCMRVTSVNFTLFYYFILIMLFIFVMLRLE
jgi:hypothetical protein